ncbi:MAG: hypothetical protein IJ268_04650 [Proteobacteria bacterium]|nr:hypothetical protein [Pseudomonadota bacterium]
MSRFSKLVTYMCAGGMCGLLWMTPAYADSCDGINVNKDWMAGFEKLNAAYSKEDWNAALKQSRELENICDQSPVLNYTIAQIHKKKGDAEKYAFYLTKATQNTERFSLDKNLLDRIWSEKYLATHPEADPKNIEAIKAENANLRKALDDGTVVSKDKYFGDQVDEYKSLMWTGVGVGIAGVVMVGVGAALVAVNDPADFSGSVGASYKANNGFVAGGILLGAGAAFAIAGGVFGGISGYKYKHAKESMTFSLNISHNSAMLTIDF